MGHGQARDMGQARCIESNMDKIRSWKTFFVKDKIVNISGFSRGCGLLQLLTSTAIT